MNRMRHFAERLGRIALAGAIAGGLAGLVWGGIGGRIAMRIIFLTSDERFAGLESDDGFTIGQFSASTMFLVMATTMIGGFLGPVAALLRTAMRNRTVIAATGFAVAFGAFVGGAIVRADGIDFRLLGPLVLTVGLFVLIPAGAAFTAVFLLDHLLRPGGRISRLPSGLAIVICAFAPFPFIVSTGAAIRTPLGLLILMAAVGGGVGIAALGTGDSAGRRRRAAHWVVWVLIGAVTVVGVAELARDIAALT